MIPLNTGGVWGLGGWGDWEGVSDGGGGRSNLKITLENESGQKTKKNRNLAFFYSKRPSSPAGNEV